MAREPHVAYFCMEYGLSESFPIYSGGLGVLAGDFIRSARDLGAPVVAVGLRWERGYAVQRIGSDGAPEDAFATYDASFLEDTGVRVHVRVRGAEVTCAVRVTTRFGNVPLYLLDPLRAEDRWITSRLYEAGTDVRIAQEMLLGIGGVRALHWLGLPVATYHFNEGHAVFAGVELIAVRMADGMTFPDAWADTRRRIVFTTHTPVKAGNEEHTIKDLRRMGACLELSGAEMRAIGGDPFNMTIAGLKLARRANGVSALHAETARAMWAHVEGAAPIIGIVNGVHAPSWQDASIRAAAGDPGHLWAAHTAQKRELGATIAARAGVTPDPAALWIGIARRAAGYKRNDLVLRDAARLERLLAAGAVLVFSGKAHPDDAVGRAIVARIVDAARRHPGRVVFLENYDIALARLLTRGCDAWLNNPVRPLEASGTSGMKAALNGLPNVSVLDGWWAEGYRPGENGWAIGDASAGDDEKDAAALHDTLAGQVLPAWADAARWRAMMRASIAVAEERFTAERMVREYFARLYAEGGS
ncbi:MAG: alpha-glucan family phosphorylase [Candidatus Eisenbacteria bacterium]|uniref:glycogen phosphorylase n=1 Tax=Eiseniibacteriota bacterium TaxID=2212470 RepID=A0A9D6L4A2_UNCEI|nr:alpha-glucan family phosphorylase [Candidatus Eisenbacteria bacterium]